MKIVGIAASPGLAVGPIVVMQSEEFAIREFPIRAERVDEELALFERALGLARRDLEQIRDGIAAELGEAEAAIYAAHLMILEDPELRRAIENGIRTQLRNAGVVFRDYMGAVATRLQSVEDEYLRERHADILDVERRVLRYLVGGGQRGPLALTEPAIVIAHDVGPSDVALLDRKRVLGLVTEVGGRTSHSAIVARGRGIPAVVGARGAVQHARTSQIGVVDGDRGVVDLQPDAAELAEYRARRVEFERTGRALRELCELPAVTLDGKRIELGANIELPGDVENVAEAGADGIGLFRTEFFYLDRASLPSEEEQFRAYRSVAERLAPRPVIFRTMDLGGDKVASYLGTTHETNPFLGYRGIRFALHHPEIFRAQIRAIYRASAFGRARLMFPMISNLEELRRATALCHEVADELRSTGVAFDEQLEVGMMVETPSAVWVADHLARESAFFSIGTNDLTQYTLAMDRDNERLAHLYQPLHPAVLRSIRHTVQCALAAGRWAGVCGEMAGDPLTAVLLIGIGVEELSVSCFDLPRVKAAIRRVSLAGARELADRALELGSGEQVAELLKAWGAQHLPVLDTVDRSAS
ncbi:MAG: phosphoenolpyruvate--protein phosphotransferase [Candidatus Eisenbacteria bacterium]|uniref:Phosphoenolpyruvate-protein phosphotransferase n=1 Tax=Eiseniibacteriota bacterium TaxID=2212470 RepID=A0A849SEK1_UNCEI|nr:phosphoenolpyruvate--protein phosphotransferase [Candidatus Eisenbacteria bacterium]